MNETVFIRLLDASVATNYNLILGFIPSHVKVLVCHSAPILYQWWGKIMENSAEAISGSWEYGIKLVGGSSATYMTTPEAGISAFDGAKTPLVLIQSPSSGELIKVAIYGDYDPLVDYNSVGTDRSATVIGTIIRPTTHNGYVYELKTKTGGAASTEPTWGKVPGETTTDTVGNIWICREENVVANKGLGITLGYDLLENGKEVYIEAYRSLREEDIGLITY